MRALNSAAIDYVGCAVRAYEACEITDAYTNEQRDMAQAQAMHSLGKPKSEGKATRL